jgi:two-component SAPR family response regulator
MMFCLLFYKRRSEKKFLSMITGQKKRLEAKTFGNFTLLHEGKTIKFSRSKTTELVAYLICKNGSSANTKELLSVLYGDYADSARYGSSFRSLVSDAKHTFAELEIQNFFTAEYNNFRINPEAVKCDYYDFLAGEPDAIKRYAGEFMNQYSWAEDTAAFLERKALAG